MTDTMTDQSQAADIITFVAVSSVLTGIAVGKLSPLLDPTDVKTQYFNYAQSQDSAKLQQLLTIYRSNASQPAATIAAAIFGSDVAWFARSVMLEWYLSTWYTPTDLQHYAANPGPATTPNGTVISSVAYTQGWAWNVAQAHPMGFSNFRFGYWESDPPSLSAFVGGTP